MRKGCFGLFIWVWSWFHNVSCKDFYEISYVFIGFWYW